METAVEEIKNDVVYFDCHKDFLLRAELIKHVRFLTNGRIPLREKWEGELKWDAYYQYYFVNELFSENLPKEEDPEFWIKQVKEHEKECGIFVPKSPITPEMYKNTETMTPEMKSELNRQRALWEKECVAVWYKSEKEASDLNIYHWSISCRKVWNENVPSDFLARLEATESSDEAINLLKSLQCDKKYSESKNKILWNAVYELIMLARSNTERELRAYCEANNFKRLW